MLDIGLGTGYLSSSAGAKQKRQDAKAIEEQAYVEGSKSLRIRDEKGALWGSTNRYEESSGCVKEL